MMVYLGNSLEVCTAEFNCLLNEDMLVFANLISSYLYLPDISINLLDGYSSLSVSHITVSTSVRTKVQGA
jgi:hypothetical protein